jgi:hypothetical protein
VPLLHHVPPEHWLSSVHEPVQPPEQVYGAQLSTIGVEHAPAPLHFVSRWKCVASWQNAPMQTTLVPACVQAPPVQVPVLPQGGLAGHWPCGSGAPLATLPQLPDEHVWQVPQADMLQQNPSTQRPVVHSWPPVGQVLPDPGAFLGKHAPFGPPSQ